MSKHANVTFHFTNVMKIYRNVLRCVQWPKIPFKVMDVGCGSGRLLLEQLKSLLPDHYSEIVGTDIDEEMINYCKTLKVDSRISFEPMSIESKFIPEKYQKSFDFLFSTFVLHYVKDIRQALVNSSNLLKPKGVLVFIYMYKSNPLHEVYKRMYYIDEWKPYTEEFVNYVPLVRSDNPIDETKILFQECGFEILNIELKNDPYECTAESLLELFNAVDMVYSVIPNDKKLKYQMVFNELLGNIVGFSLAEQDLKKTLHLYFPAIVVHARNSF